MRRLCLLLTLALFIAPATSVLAQKTWDGGAGTDQWTGGDNWNPNGGLPPTRR